MTDLQGSERQTSSRVVSSAFRCLCPPLSHSYCVHARARSNIALQLTGCLMMINSHHYIGSYYSR